MLFDQRSCFRPVYNPNDDSVERHDAPEPITAGAGFYQDLDTPTPAPEIPYIVYSNEENPWTVINNGLQTNHLYKRTGDSTSQH